MKQCMFVLVFSLFLAGCVKETVNKTAEKINQVADKTTETVNKTAEKINEVADKTTETVNKTAETINEVADKTDQMKDKIGELTDLSTLKDSWNVVQKTIDEKITEEQKQQLEDLKIQLEKTFGTSIVQLKKIGNDLLVKFGDGEEIKLNLQEALEPQLEKLKSMLKF